MEEMKNLRDLLKHQLQDLYSAEDQMLEGLPKMIEQAGNEELKSALHDHYQVTEKHKSRLDRVKKMLSEEASGEDKGFFARLFTPDEMHHCVAMEGLVREGEKTMKEKMEPEVMDAAIIAAAQRIEHYEISGYGTAKAYALHLGLRQVAGLLDETLKEEYEADSLLTDLAIGEINLDAAGNTGLRVANRLSGGKTVPKTRVTTIPVKTSGKANNGRTGSKKTSPNPAGKKSAGRSATGKSGGRTTRSRSRTKTGSSKRGGR